MSDDGDETLREVDLLVVGSGVAGLSAAVRAADIHGLRVGVLTKGELEQSTTRWAQGGVAAVLAEDPDSTDLHLADTLSAGAGLCEVEAVRVLVDEGPGRVQDLIALGAMFDRDAHGELQLAREGGHTLPRIVHAGGAATGAEIERALVEAVQRTAAAVHEHAFALDLLIDGGRAAGVRAVTADGRTVDVRARHVLLATGGAGQVFSVTTNPLEATGDGVAMALRAGVAVADVEFVQFHPTALHHPRMPRPLLSEALRGHGALLRDTTGARFVDELLPRDEVSRAMTRRMLDLGVDHCWLDATGLEDFAARFPTIMTSLAEAGLDPTVDWLPIAPAAHYLCGGIVTDLDGASSLPGLWSAGEAACSGVHGANRLASNSLLEGMVFGARVVEAVERGVDGPRATGAMRGVLETTGPDAIGASVLRDWTPPGRLPRVASGDAPSPAEVAAARDRLQRAMTTGAGVLRSADSLADTDLVVAEVTAVAARGADPSTWELANLAVNAAALLDAAEARLESRGAHTRSDHPAADPAFRRRLVLGGGLPAGPSGEAG
ncbi:L-aspartate oxidase [Rhabdothermincola salaria]|uniref:L-aspartate oxidase n=1 Tax=Rhabdothermincola salaria TaxID=2903142 RepID=UPI001E4FB60A|nr:FAD-binding protein [Rhabdothermincola salaria]